MLLSLGPGLPKPPAPRGSKSLYQCPTLPMMPQSLHSQKAVRALTVRVVIHSHSQSEQWPERLQSMSEVHSALSQDYLFNFLNTVNINIFFILERICFSFLNSLIEIYNYHCGTFHTILSLLDDYFHS